MRLSLLALALLAAAQTPAPAMTGSYEAISTTAMSITGSLTLTAGALTFTMDQSYQTQAPSPVDGSTVYGKGAGTFAALLGVPEETRMELRRVSRQKVGLRARNGGLCGPDTTTFIVLARGLDLTGEQALKLAAFKGTEPPGPSRDGANLCGTFTYAPMTANARR